MPSTTLFISAVLYDDGMGDGLIRIGENGRGRGAGEGVVADHNGMGSR